MRFFWTFLAGAALLLLAAFAAPFPLQNPALAQFSSAPDDASNPILQLPAPPQKIKVTPQKITPAPQKIKATPQPTPLPLWKPRFAGQKSIRVGLSTAGSAIRVYFPGGATVWENNLYRLKIAAGEMVAVSFSPGERSGIALQMASGRKLSCSRAYFAVSGAAARVSSDGKSPRYGRPYRGDLEVFPQKMQEPVKRRGALALVNVVPLESYLKGVVPWEMAPDAPFEALKAQAICARTKTLDFVASKRFAAGGFDVCDYDACQGYPGVENEKPATSAAVEATKGLAIYYKNRPIDAVYSTNSGGITAGARDVWKGATPIDYLQSVADFRAGSPLAKLWEGGMTEGEWAQFCAQDFASFARPDGVASNKYEARKYRWSEFVSVEAATKAFAPEGFGAVTNLEVAARAASGRIKLLRVSGFPPAPQLMPNLVPNLVPNAAKTAAPPGEFARAPKTLILEGDGKIRSMFSKRLGSTSALPSSLFTLSPQTDAGGKLTGWNLRGAGWGHGVGMCQRGAQNHARQGWNARQILKHYYRGVEIR